MWYDGLKEQELWKNFQALAQIPRESGNEEGIRNYLLSWAGEHGIQASADKVGNVYFRTPATKGYEQVPAICLQGHMDMVCVRTRESQHDFTKDPIDIQFDGTCIKAKDTTLGADNGIAIAMAMTLLADSACAHGPLECLFTVSEETGMNGANGYETGRISARRMINIDSEEEGILYIGCAGGIDVTFSKRAPRSAVYAQPAYFSLVVSGLLGGHSGGDIHKGRANAIKLVSRILHRLPAYQIVDLQGGTKRNVIPSEATVRFCVEEKDAALVQSIVDQVQKEVSEEFRLTDPRILIALQREKDGPAEAVKEKASHDFIEAIYLTPWSMQKMSAAVPGVVETSNNVAIVHLTGKGFFLECSTRSLLESAKLEMAYQVGAAGEAYGCTVSYQGSYPGWAPDRNSLLEKEMEKAYREYTGKEPIVTCIHAGLECGLINARVPGMDSISIGPNLWDVHSVSERLEVASAERMLGFLRYFLETRR